MPQIVLPYFIFYCQAGMFLSGVSYFYFTLDLGFKPSLQQLQ
jgi:hypothetical protein